MLSYVQTVQLNVGKGYQAKDALIELAVKRDVSAVLIQEPGTQHRLAPDIVMSEHDRAAVWVRDRNHRPVTLVCETDIVAVEVSLDVGQVVL